MNRPPFVPFVVENEEILLMMKYLLLSCFHIEYEYYFK